MTFLDQFAAYRIEVAEFCGQPHIIPCAEWGAAPARATSPLITPRAYINHHTAGPNRPLVLSRADQEAAGKALARSIQRAHLDIGDSDTGQHLTLTREGLCFEGRHGSAAAFLRGLPIPQGAQAIHWNGVSVGVEHEGLYTSEIPPRPLMVASLRLQAWACLVYGIDSTNDEGHRDVCKGVDATACPGDAFYSILPACRALVHEAVLLMRSRYHRGPDGIWRLG